MPASTSKTPMIRATTARAEQDNKIGEVEGMQNSGTVVIETPDTFRQIV
jgi:hypothetical protein